MLNAFQHNPQNFFICFFHSFFADLSYAADGFAGFFLENSGVWRIGLTVHSKMMCQECSIKTGGNFRCTGYFRSISDDSRNIGKRILYGLLDHRKFSTAHVSNSGTGCTGCGYCTAKCGKFTYILFLIYS